MTATSESATAHAATSGPPPHPVWRRRGHRVLVVLLALGLVAALLVWAIPAPPSRLTLATGFAGGAYEHFGQRYAQALAASKVTVTLRPTQGSLENLALLSRADAPIQAAFVQGGVGAKPGRMLRVRSTNKRTESTCLSAATGRPAAGSARGSTG